MGVGCHDVILATGCRSAQHGSVFASRRLRDVVELLRGAALQRHVNTALRTLPAGRATVIDEVPAGPVTLPLAEGRAAVALFLLGLSPKADLQPGASAARRSTSFPQVGKGDGARQTGWGSTS